MKFSRDNNGKLDVSNGTYSRGKVTLTNCMYTDEVRMCFGVAFVTPIIDVVEQPQEVRSCKHFFYSGNILLSMMDFNKKVQNEIFRSEGTERGGTHQGGLRFLSRQKINST